MSGRQLDNGVLGSTDVMLQYINKNFISLNDTDTKEYGDDFRKVIGHLIDLMKEVDPLFKAIYRELEGAGSYFDGLKVGKPSEFDMDLIVSLPINYQAVSIENQGVPAGYVKVCMKKMDQLRQHPRWTAAYRFLDDWRNPQGYLLQDKFRQWMESVVNRALNKLKVGKNTSELIHNGMSYKISLKKSGPAMTLQLQLPRNRVVDVDLVPVIEFSHPHWPPSPPARGPPPNMAKKTWFIVPKPKKVGNENSDNTHWRVAFNQQEKQMINGKKGLKPVCRLLKKLRDETPALTLLPSYYIKTVFLWEIEKKQDDSRFWETRLILLFEHMLKKLIACIENGNIPFFWDSRCNLLETVTGVQRKQMSSVLNKVISDLNANVFVAPGQKSNAAILAKWLLAKHELAQFENNRNTLQFKPPVATRNVEPQANEPRAAEKVWGCIVC